MAITTAERTQIIELTTLMFDAAPGAFYLSQIVAVYEGNGRSLQSLANILGSTGIYQSLNPNFQTATEFAAKLLTPLGLQGDALATDFIVTRFNAGQSKASIVFQAFNALNGVTTNDAAKYQAAKLALVNLTTVAEFYSVTAGGTATDLATLQAVVTGVTSDPATVVAAEAAINNGLGLPATTFDLTTGIDTVVGTPGNDTVIAVLDDADPTKATFTNLDSIDTGAGNDTILINDLDPAGSSFPAGVTVKNVETAVLRGAGVVAVDVTTAVGLTKVQVTQATAATVKAAGTTAVEVTGAGGNIVVDGGSTVNVTATGAGTSVTVGATTVSKGAVSVTHGSLGSALIAIDGGTDVTVNTSGVATGSLTVANVGQGGAATDLPSGAVVVNVTGAAYKASDATAAFGAVNVTGGATVTVNEKATSSSAAAAADTTVATLTQGAVGVTGGASTTAVTILQDAAVLAKNAVVAVAGVKQVDTVTFIALGAGQAVTVDGLTFTASKALTAAQVAAAFANLGAGATQGAGAAGNGIYNGTFGT